MLLHRREDFLSDRWPSTMRAEARRLKLQVESALLDATRRLFGRATRQTLRLTAFAILDVPFAAVHRHVADNEMPPATVDALISTAYAALIRPRRNRTGNQAQR
jgi:hypothetical protein